MLSLGFFQPAYRCGALTAVMGSVYYACSHPLTLDPLLLGVLMVEASLWADDPEGEQAAGMDADGTLRL